MQLHDILGLVGVALIVGAYLLLQIEKLDSRGLAFSVANGVGAGLVLLSLWFDFNTSAFLVEAFWLAISLVGIGKWVRRRGTSPAS